MSLRHWSSRAEADFAALFEDASHSETFRVRVAEALVRGWGGNKDKPLWALALLVAAFAEAERITSRRASALSLLALGPGDVLARLAALRRRRPESIGRARDGRMVVLSPIGNLAIGAMRILLLRKVAEFLLFCDESRHAPSVMATFEQLDRAGLDDAEVLRAGIQALSRTLYAYRAAHFREGHAASGFDAILGFLARLPRDAQLDEDAPLAFWVWDGNDRYRTYKACLFALADFVASAREAGERAALSNAADIDDPALAGAVATEDPLDAIEAIEDAAEDADEMPAEAPAGALGALDASGLRLYTRQEIELLAPLFDLDDFADAFPLALIRFYAFHPIQSGISNELRTGRAKVRLAERLACHEAESYEALRARLAGLAAKTRQWLQVAYGLRAEGEGVNETVRNQGLAVLAASRAKALTREREAVGRDFASVEPALIEVLARIERYLAALDRSLRRRGVDRAALFEADRARFSDMFRRLYADAGKERAE